jgi:hypothetical protein
MPRGKDNLIATLEVVDVSGATVEVRVWTKNSQDSGDGDDAKSAISISSNSVDRRSATWYNACKEWVRYKISVTGSAGDWVLFRMLDAIWFDTETA